MSIFSPSFCHIFDLKNGKNVSMLVLPKFFFYPKAKITKGDQIEERIWCDVCVFIGCCASAMHAYLPSNIRMTHKIEMMMMQSIRPTQCTDDVKHELTIRTSCLSILLQKTAGRQSASRHPIVKWNLIWELPVLFCSISRPCISSGRSLVFVASLPGFSDLVCKERDFMSSAFDLLFETLALST